MRLLCPHCEEMTVPEDTDLDGAYFGTSWLQMLFLVHPETRPKKFPTRYVPRVFGFKVHPSAYEVPKRDNCMFGFSLCTRSLSYSLPVSSPLSQCVCVCVCVRCWF